MSARTGYGVLPCSLMDDPNVSCYAKIVYAVLSSYAGLESVFPSHKTIAEKASISERQVRNALNELKALELVEWQTVPTKKGRISVYRTIGPWSGGPAPRAVPDPAPHAAPQGVRHTMPEK